MITVFHNPRCGKSRNCLAILDQANLSYEIKPYLTENPSRDEIKELLKKLSMNPIELIRVKEKIWIDNFKGKELSDNQIIDAMVSNPILIERPILIIGDKAIIARDPKVIESFIKKP